MLLITGDEIRHLSSIPQLEEQIDPFQARSESFNYFHSKANYYSTYATCTIAPKVRLNLAVRFQDTEQFARSRSQVSYTFLHP